MTDYVSEGAFELAGCPQMGGMGEPRTSNWTGGRAGWALKYNPLTRHVLGLGEPRVPGYTGGSGGPITLQVGDKPEYTPLLRFAQPVQAPSASGSTGAPVRGGSYRRSTAHQNYGRGRLFGLGTWYSTAVGNCPPCGMGAFSIESLGLGFNLKTVAIVAAVAFAASVVARQMKKGKRRNRRRNAPFAVKGVFGAIGPARAAYAAMPGGGYKSLIDVNRRKGRSGRYSSRKIVAQHRLPAGSF